MSGSEAMGERVARVETWQAGHEKVCADRYRLLLATIGVGVSIILGVSGWGLIRTFNGQDEQIRLLRDLTSRPPAAAAVAQR